MADVVKTTFGDGTDMERALNVIISFCIDPYSFWAAKLKENIDYPEGLVRIVISRCEIDIYRILEEFDKKYGEGNRFKEGNV